MVECSPATRAARVRFPDDAKPFSSCLFLVVFSLERKKNEKSRGKKEIEKLNNLFYSNWYYIDGASTYVIAMCKVVTLRSFRLVKCVNERVVCKTKWSTKEYFSNFIL